MDVAHDHHAGEDHIGFEAYIPRKQPRKMELLTPRSSKQARKALSRLWMASSRPWKVTYDGYSAYLFDIAPDIDLPPKIWCFAWDFRLTPRRTTRGGK